MTIFYRTIVMTFLLSLSSRILCKKIKFNEWMFIVAVILICVIVAGLRNNIGDTGAYMHSYTLLNTFNGITESMEDKGFILFQVFLYNIYSDPQFLIIITSIITQVLNIYTLAIYRSYFELQIFMYIASGYFLVTMNGIRQAMVAAIIFAGTRLIIKGKFIPYLILVYIASTMHGSAMIMIPIYFICREEAWSKRTKIIIVAASVGFLFFYQLMPVFFDMLGDSKYTEYEAMMTDSSAGASVIRFIINAVPTILAYIKREQLKEIWPESKVFVNMSLINLIVMAFSLYNWIFARFSIYFQLYNFVLLPFIVKNCFSRKEKGLVYYLFIVCYFIFFYYEHVISLGIVYKSKYL